MSSSSSSTILLSPARSSRNPALVTRVTAILIASSNKRALPSLLPCTTSERWSSLIKMERTSCATRERTAPSKIAGRSAIIRWRMVIVRISVSRSHPRNGKSESAAPRSANAARATGVIAHKLSKIPSNLATLSRWPKIPSLSCVSASSRTRKPSPPANISAKTLPLSSFASRLQIKAASFSETLKSFGLMILQQVSTTASDCAAISRRIAGSKHRLLSAARPSSTNEADTNPSCKILPSSSTSLVSLIRSVARLNFGGIKSCSLSEKAIATRASKWSSYLPK
mmetsp:Transcript_54734/g.120030  ORF Transcript_54734/g.120030 Transcript_54734/m.120030 type:complete len:283 (-) Transcript_54734:1581-2429(-)